MSTFSGSIVFCRHILMAFHRLSDKVTLPFNNNFHTTRSALITIAPLPFEDDKACQDKTPEEGEQKRKHEQLDSLVEALSRLRDAVVIDGAILVIQQAVVHASFILLNKNTETSARNRNRRRSIRRTINILCNTHYLSFLSLSLSSLARSLSYPLL